MEQMNKVELRGRVGLVRINELKNKTVCRFSVVTNTIYHNAESALVEEATWHSCTLWSGKRYPDLSFIRTGLSVEIHGRLRSSKYTGADGSDRYSTEVIVNELILIPDGEQLKSENLV